MTDWWGWGGSGKVSGDERESGRDVHSRAVWLNVSIRFLEGEKGEGMHLSGLSSGLRVPPVGPWGVSVRRFHCGFRARMWRVWTHVEEGLDTLGVLGGLVALCQQ